MLFENLNEAAQRVGDRYNNYITSDDTSWVTSWNATEQQFSRDLLKLGLSWPDERKILAPLIGNTTAYQSEGIRFFATVVIALFNNYGVQGDRETLALAQSLIGNAENATQAGFEELNVRRGTQRHGADARRTALW